MTTIPSDRPGSGWWLLELFFAWLAYWVFVLLGLAILAGTILVPMWIKNQHYACEYQVQIYRNDKLAERVDEMTSQIDAIKEDPQYTEHIIQRELNLRDPNVEVLTLQTTNGSLDDDEATPENLLPPDYSGYRFVEVFTDAKRKPWLLTLSLGLILAGMIVAIGHRIRIVGR